MIKSKHTHEWITKWLLRWLEIPLDDDGITILFKINETDYEFCFHFRIAFTIYGIFKDHSTHELIWFSFENDHFTDDAFLLAPRFKCYEDLIHFVTDIFYKKWNTDATDRQMNK